jgi:metal-responsive CopG/Arc/MetJ family transcriptional regulator
MAVDCERGFQMPDLVRTGVSIEGSLLEQFDKAIVKKDREKSYGFRTLVHEIVQSRLFQTK